MQPLQLCTGHFGHIRLPLPVFHIGYLRFIQTILQNICKVSARSVDWPLGNVH